ncbi:MAG: CHASE4 domain-containing protein [Opitutaceae bacterium]
MSVKSRILALFAATFALFLVFLIALWKFEKLELRNAVERTRTEQTSILEHWIELSGTPLQQFARDYSWWDDMVSFVKNPSPEWSKINIDLSLADFSASAAWVYGPDGKLVYGVNRLDASTSEPPFNIRELLAKAQGEFFVHCYAKTPQGLLELRVAPIHPSAATDRKGTPLGWFIVACLWDQSRIASLSAVSESQVALGEKAAPAENKDAVITVSVPLMDLNGAPSAFLRANHHSIAIEEMTLFDNLQAALFAACCLIMSLAFFSAVRRWILNPLSSIEKTLSSGDPSHLDKLIGRKDEFGEMSRVVADAAMHQKELENEVMQRTLAEDELRVALDSRARLSRDLHDGVIQTLYAAGMGLGGIRSMLEEKQQDALVRLDQTRVLLNEVIRDLRGFITDMEPESLKHASFTQAVQRIIDQMQVLAPFIANLDVDEDTAAALPLSHRVHVLQSIREAVSNSLRHGKANAITISLILTGRSARLVIEDTGTGFPSGTPPSLGNGLENLSKRAGELGGTFNISSIVGAGARVQLEFPLPEES